MFQTYAFRARVHKATAHHMITSMVYSRLQQTTPVYNTVATPTHGVVVCGATIFCVRFLLTVIVFKSQI